MNRDARAIVFSEPDHVEVREIVLGPTAPDELLCETVYSFVSPGTELRVLQGAHESKDRFPLIPGYSWVGRVREVGRRVHGWSVGELVTGRNPLPVAGYAGLWGGQASHHRVSPVGEDRVLKLPPGAEPWAYVPLETAAISWRGISMAAPQAGETAVVIGQGLIGSFSTWWLLAAGVRVVAVDLNEQRLERVRGWGAWTVDAGHADHRAQLSALLNGGADIVVEASASEAGCRLAAAMLRDTQPRRLMEGYSPAGERHWPRLVLQASYTTDTRVRPGELIGSEGALVLKPGDRTVDDRLAVMERIRRGALPVERIIQRATPVADAPEAYADLLAQRSSTVAFRW